MNKFLKHKLLLKIMGIALLAAIIGALFVRYHLWMYLSLDGFNKYHERILNFEEQHILEFTCLYILSYVVLIALCVPGTILFDLLAGFIYGPYIGIILVLFCYLGGAIVNFLLVRYLLKDICHKHFFHLRHVIMRDSGIRGTAINLIGLRFIPVIPFWLLNILAAILDIPLMVFILTTFIGIIPASVIYVLIGDGVRAQLHAHKALSADILADPKLWVPLIMLALLILVPNMIKSFRHRQIKSH